MHPKVNKSGSLSPIACITKNSTFTKDQSVKKNSMCFACFVNVENVKKKKVNQTEWMDYIKIKNVTYQKISLEPTKGRFLKKIFTMQISNA